MFLFFEFFNFAMLLRLGRVLDRCGSLCRRDGSVASMACQSSRFNTMIRFAMFGVHIETDIGECVSPVTGLSH